jgi:hypothetical protein
MGSTPHMCQFFHFTSYVDQILSQLIYLLNDLRVIRFLPIEGFNPRRALTHEKLFPIQPARVMEVRWFKAMIEVLVGHASTRIGKVGSINKLGWWWMGGGGVEVWFDTDVGHRLRAMFNFWQGITSSYMMTYKPTIIGQRPWQFQPSS